MSKTIVRQTLEERNEENYFMISDLQVSDPITYSLIKLKINLTGHGKQPTIYPEEMTVESHFDFFIKCINKVRIRTSNIIGKQAMRILRDSTRLTIDTGLPISEFYKFSHFEEIVYDFSLELIGSSINTSIICLKQMYNGTVHLIFGALNLSGHESESLNDDELIITKLMESFVPLLE